MLDTINTSNETTNYTSEASPEVMDPNPSEINQKPSSDSDDQSQIDFKQQDPGNSEEVVIQSSSSSCPNPDLKSVSSPKLKSFKRKKQSTLSSILSSPSPSQTKGIEMYDINPNLLPGEKRRRQFLNSKFDSLCKKYPSSTKKQIRSEANKLWNLEKANQMEGEFKDVTDSLVKAAKEKGHLQLKKSTISNNLKRIAEAKSNMEMAKDNITSKFYETELKKANEALRRNSNLRRSEIDNILKGQEIEEIEEVETGGNEGAIRSDAIDLIHLD